MQIFKNQVKGMLIASGILLGGFSTSFSQTTVTFPYTGGPVNWTVPNCVTSITITVAGAQGGNATMTTGAPVIGGLGAVVTATIPVNPGDVIDMTIGGQGGLGTALGFNGGGSGFFSSDGNLNNASASGGGSTNVNINGSPVIIAAGGGGAGGGSYSFSAETNVGGDGGCATGEAQSPGSPWIGVGGGGGTQVGPGAGGAPWAGVPPGGSPGIGGIGGIGGQWQTAPGGGGGGGYFGGGGGGNDGCCTGANGGAGGGGGSSLVPGGAGCTQGANTGNGSVTITYTGGGSTASIAPALVCEGSTTTVTLTGLTGTAIQWEVSTDGGVTFNPIPGATASTYTSGPLTADVCYRANETAGSCGISPYSNVVCCAVTPMPAPNAGLDDSLCFPTGYALQGTSSGGTTTWTMTQGPLGTPAPPNAIYAPNNTVLTATATVNYAGMYTFTLTEVDPTGVCPSATDQVNILYAKETHTTTFTDPTCFGFTDGSITVTTTGNPGAVQYSFDGGATYQASNTLNTFGAGTYTVVSMDAVGCTASSNVTLTDPPLVVVNPSNDTTVCQNGTATVSASATGGTTYSFHWSQTPSLLPSQLVSPTVPTTVDVYAENEFGCISSTETITISMHGPILLNVSPNDTVCPGYVSGASVNAAGGFMGYTYSWTANGAGIPGSTNTISTNPAVQTQYCVTVGDACETTPVNICTNTIMREVPNPIFISDTTQGCAPTVITFTNLTPAYLVDSVTWNIEGVITHDLLTVSHNFINVGLFDVFLEVYTPYGCHNSITAADYITIHGYPEALFYANPNPTTIFNTEITLTDLSTPGNNTYVWSTPGGNPSSSTSQNVDVMYPDGIANDYPVTLIVNSEFNCADTVTSIISIQSDVLIYAPNVFTPDGDEFNEFWRVYIQGIDIYDFHLTMYNRWGEIVWESYNPEGAWDGTYGTTESKTGTYVWVIEAKDPFSDKKYEFRGHVTVLK